MPKKIVNSLKTMSRDSKTLDYNIKFRLPSDSEIVAHALYILATL